MDFLKVYHSKEEEELVAKIWTQGLRGLTKEELELIKANSYLFRELNNKMRVDEMTELKIQIENYANQLIENPQNIMGIPTGLLSCVRVRVNEKINEAVENNRIR